MKEFYAVYDKNDNFITCGFGASELKMNNNSFFSRLHKYKQKNKSLKVFEIPLIPQKDIFYEEDKIFLEEEGGNIYFDREIAEREGISMRTLYRRKQKITKN